MARIFRRDQIGAGENGKGAKRNVGEIADRRRHEIEPRRKRPLELVGERGFGALKQPARWLLIVLFAILHASAYSVSRGNGELPKVEPAAALSWLTRHAIVALRAHHE